MKALVFIVKRTFTFLIMFIEMFVAFPFVFLSFLEAVGRDRDNFNPVDTYSGKIVLRIMDFFDEVLL